MTTLELVSTYTLVRCCQSDCSIDFAVPQTWVTARRRDHTWWFCPNGHRQHWPQESDVEQAERLARDLKISRDRARAQVVHERDQREAAERSARAYKGVATRVKNRAAHGVCPVPGCQRSFANVARHVAGQHPDFVAEHQSGDAR